MEKNLYRTLREMGLNANAAKSKTAEAVVDTVLAEDIGRIKAVNARLTDIEDTLQGDGEKIKGILDSFQKLSEVEGELSSDRAKDALLLWREMLRVALEYGVDPSSAAQNISYVMYAVFGGQAKTIIGGPQ